MPEMSILDVTKVRHVTVFLDRLDDFSVAEQSELSHDGNRDHGAKRLTVSAFIGVIEGDEAVDDGLPRYDGASDDEIVGGIGEMGLDPLSAEGILKRVCYHGGDLVRG